MKKVLFARALKVLVPCLGLCVALGYCFYTGIFWFNNPSLDQYPVRGVDVSHHQGEIDWPLLAQHNIRFVFIKATEGGDFKDPRFGANWKNALKTPLVVGAYHFFLPTAPGQDQADNFIKSVPKLPNTLPPVLDVECAVAPDEPSRRAIRQNISECLSILEEHYGRTPIIYTTYEAYQAYIHGSFTEYPLWIRSIFTSPVFEDGRTWMFWQFTSRAQLPGYVGREKFIDLNVFKGTEADFSRFVSP